MYITHATGIPHLGSSLGIAIAPELLLTSQFLMREVILSPGPSLLEWLGTE
jgi:hypothetical protein